jgi:anthraniloyl-CoA monooxygenase
MKIAIVGGGPAGLYFAILMKKADPGSRITVHERNRVDDTFGFGVVFSDQTLDTFERTIRRPTGASCASSPTGTTSRSTSRARRTGSAATASAAARGARSSASSMSGRANSASISCSARSHRHRPLARGERPVVLADGVNSRFREQYRDHFRPSIDLRPNKFAWMGSTTPLDAFTFAFEETEHGVFIAHAYQYDEDQSTWIFETDAETFERAGLGALDEEASARAMERIFGKYLKGHPIITNRSHWRNFPMIRNRALGEGQHGPPRRRQGDGAFLHRLRHQARHGGRHRAPRSLRRRSNRRRGADRFESTRRDEVERTQHAADVSLVFFEHLPLLEFRPGAVRLRRDDARQGDHLRQPSPPRAGVRRRSTVTSPKACARRASTSSVDKPVPPMFQPFSCAT